MRNNRASGGEAPRSSRQKPHLLNGKRPTHPPTRLYHKPERQDEGKILIVLGIHFKSHLIIDLASEERGLPLPGAPLNGVYE